jgi:ribose transport system substrate-binding protein
MTRLTLIGVAALLAGLAFSAEAQDKKLSLGIVTFSTNDINTNDMVASMTKDAEGKGWTVTNLDGRGDPSQANTAIKQLITRKADAIIVTVFDSTSLASGVAAAKDAGVPVLSAGGGLAPGIAYAASTGAAPPVIDLMLKDLGNKGTALDLSYHAGIPCRERADAFDAAVKANPGIKATTHEIQIQSAAASSQAATSAWLAATAKAEGPFAIMNCFDDNAMGAIAALRQNGRTDVKVYSFNATPPALQAVKDGTMRATLWIDLRSAGTILVDAVPEILKAGASWQPKSVVPGHVVVTKENLDDFLKEHPNR